MKKNKKLLILVNDLGFFVSHRLLIAEASIAKGFEVVIGYGELGNANKKFLIYLARRRSSFEGQVHLNKRQNAERTFRHHIFYRNNDVFQQLVSVLSRCPPEKNLVRVYLSHRRKRPTQAKESG